MASCISSITISRYIKVGVAHKSTYPAAIPDYIRLVGVAPRKYLSCSYTISGRGSNNRLVGVAPRKLAVSNGHSFVLQTALTNKWVWLSVCLQRDKWAWFTKELRDYGL